MNGYSVHSENGIAPTKNTNTVYSEYFYSGIVPKERDLNNTIHKREKRAKEDEYKPSHWKNKTKQTKNSDLNKNALDGVNKSKTETKQQPNEQEQQFYERRKIIKSKTSKEK